MVTAPRALWEVDHEVLMEVKQQLAHKAMLAQLIWGYLHAFLSAIVDTSQ